MNFLLSALVFGHLDTIKFACLVYFFFLEIAGYLPFQNICMVGFRGILYYITQGSIRARERSHLAKSRFTNYLLFKQFEGHLFLFPISSGHEPSTPCLDSVVEPK